MKDETHSAVSSIYSDSRVKICFITTSLMLQW